MYQGKKQQFDWTFALGVTDVVAVILAFLIANRLVNLGEGIPTPPCLTCLAFVALILVLLRRFHLYTWRAFTSAFPTILSLTLATATATIIFGILLEIFGNQHATRFIPFLLLQAAVAILVIVACRILLRWLLMDLLRLIPVERIGFIGWSPRLDRVLRAMAKEMGTFQQTLGFFQQDGCPETEGALQSGYKSLGDVDEIEEKLVENKVSLLIVEESKVSLPELQRIGEICARCFVNLKVIPTAFDIWASKVSLRMVAGTPLLGVYDLRYDRLHNRIAKRALDIACSIFGLIVSAPIIAIMIVLIKRESPGPVFFRQVRLGLHNKPFEIIKLRSMRLDAEKQTGAVWAVQDDPRRLKIGTFMRKMNIDELPQFWNVLKGDMSMVGPRPERPEFVQDFKETIHYYNLRHSCKPGVTGWAAVNGLRGSTSLEDRIEYDLYYIENWSILLDIKIILMTLLPPKNAY